MARVNNRLSEGVKKFQQEGHAEHAELFETLADHQKPHTLFIGCSDSRLVPNLITQTLPGELFVARNIGNLVPPYRTRREYAATTSAIEYAVLVLGVRDIVICGHSNCGAIAALWKAPVTAKEAPNVHRWLKLASPVKKKLGKALDAEVLEAAEKENVLLQLKNLRTYPFIHERERKGELHLHGWFYQIESGQVFGANAEGRFDPLN